MAGYGKRWSPTRLAESGVQGLQYGFSGRKRKVEPTLVAFGGGKGGVGKSILSILTAQWLARLGKRTVLVDLDLSGANIHTLLGISDPPLSLNDLLVRKVSSLAETALQTSVRDLSVICGASENLAVANLVVARKIKLMRHLSQLEADFVLL
ncbi:MAG: P-loop NTPase, partial [Acidobacteriota bacterium]